MIGDNVGVHVAYPFQYHLIKIALEGRYRLSCFVQYMLWDQVALRGFDGACATGVCPAGKDRRTAEGVPFMTIVDDDLFAARRQQSDLYQPLFNDIQGTGKWIILIENMIVLRKTFYAGGGQDFFKNVGRQVVKWLGITQLLDVGH